MDAATTIRAARASAGLSLRTLAERAGTSHTALVAYEQGRKTPRIDTLERICRAAGYALDVDLLRRPGRGSAERGEVLADLLRLADAFPFTRSGPLTFPVFGRAESA